MTAASNTGFLYVTSIVEYCAKLLPLDMQSQSTMDCERPNHCHAVYPPEEETRLRPWRAGTPDWVTPNPEGPLVIVTGTYNLGCISEQLADPGASLLGCDVDDADADAYLEVLDRAIAGAQPGEVVAFTLVTSFGGHPNPNDLPTVDGLLETLEGYVDDGAVRFSTTAEVYADFVAHE